MTIADPSKTEAWARLTHHREVIAGETLTGLFAADEHRFERLSRSVAGMTVDFSKQRITSDTLDILFDLAKTMDVAGRRAAMFAGEAINPTENRPVLHVALRDSTDRPYVVDGENMTPEVAHTRERIAAFARDVIDGTRTGHTGKSFERVINLGVGGSDLGPRSVNMALAEYAGSGIPVDFVATVDSAALKDALNGADPSRTLFVICSKSFTTLETRANADSARAWLVDALGEEAIPAHFITVSANTNATSLFGIPEENVFPLWDWVGGRYSLWSAVGITIALGCGPDVFTRLLAGAEAMDRHFETAALSDNLPVLAGLIGVWNRDFWDCRALATLPYDFRLRLLPNCLQQLIMESNGKSVRLDGSAIEYGVSPVIFGVSGSDSQHSFMQLIHQSPMVVPVEFIVALDGQGDPQRDKLIANALAQSEALMRGRSADELSQDSGENLAPHQACPGNRPSTTILLDSLTPETLGALLAFYEHRTFVEGTLWGLNSFDQWGVELGKTLASGLLSDIATGRASAGRDSSTAGLLNAYLSRRNASTS